MVMFMFNNAELKLNFKIGVLKELHELKMITKPQMDKCIEIITKQEREGIK